MWPESPTLESREEDDRRVIPFPRSLAEGPAALEAWRRAAEHAAPVEIAPVEVARSERMSRSETAGRHYLKLLLPSIPITMFVLGFLYGSLLTDPRARAVAAARTDVQTSLPLIGALVFALTSGMLCALVYAGYLRASGQR